MLGRIGETAIAQIPERGIGIAVIFGVEISVFDRHIEPFDGFDNQIEIEPLDRAYRRVPGDGGCWRDRKSVVSGKSVSVRVDLGGRRIIQKKTMKSKYDKHTSKHKEQY